MAAAKIDSPRGPFTLSESHNPVQDIYLRQVENGENKSIGVAAKALADPGRGCTMSVMVPRKCVTNCVDAARLAALNTARRAGYAAMVRTVACLPWTFTSS